MRARVVEAQRRVWVILAMAGGLGASVAAQGANTPDNVRSCAALSGVPVTAGHVVRASIVLPPFVASWDGGAGKENVTVPFCLVEGQASSGPGSDIRFEVWLPAKGQWNGRLLGVGAGGSLGAINRADLGLGVNRGFAAVATDNGHRGYGARDSAWALGHPERVADFGYLAHHLATEAAKSLVKRYYRRPQQYAYYIGCSQGGVKGMMTAQRYPGDYDGIVAGAPVYSWSKEMTFQAWNYRALTATPAAAITEPQMQSLYSAAALQCAGPDGLIADPRKCGFDPGALQCPTAGDHCLTDIQVNAVRKMYEGPHTSVGAVLNRGLRKL